MVLGTVRGHICKIGKNILVMVMKARGLDVHNLGEYASVSTFVNKALEIKADIIGVSPLLTTTIVSPADWGGWVCRDGRAGDGFGRGADCRKKMNRRTLCFEGGKP